MQSVQRQTSWRVGLGRRWGSLAIGMAFLCSGLAESGWATTIAHYGGTYTNWPTIWTPINQLNDPNDGLTQTQLDFVGNTNSPGAYYATTSDYLFFRMRLQFAGTVSTNTSPTFHDTHMILIDALNYTHPNTVSNRPDFAFAWDSLSNDPTKHGMELMVPDPGSTGPAWSGLKMNDIDGANGSKGTNDFGTANGDGYLRTIDSQSTAQFGNTTYIDWAIKRSFLLASAPALINFPVWRIQFGSINNANDHTNLGADIAGNASASSTIEVSWSPPISTAPPAGPVPEPSTALLLLLGGGLGAAWKSRPRP